MKFDRYHDSFLNQDWFPTHEELPADAIEQICQHSLLLHLSMASMIEQLYVPIWHKHRLPTTAPVPGCQACGMEHEYWRMLLQICAEY